MTLKIYFTRTRAIDRFENDEQIHKKKQQIFTETYFILIFFYPIISCHKTLTEKSISQSRSLS